MMDAKSASVAAGAGTSDGRSDRAGEPAEFPALEQAAAPAALDIAARVARRTVARAGFVRFTLARTPAERAAVHRLRYLTCIEQGWLRPEDCPDGLERDRYDEHALHLVGWVDDVLACTTRIVLPAPGRSLPLQDICPVLDLGPTDRLVEVDRTIVAPAFRSKEHHVFMALLGRVWLELTARGYDRVCCFLATGMVGLYRRLGFEVTLLGPACDYFGEARYPACLEVLASSAQLARIHLLPRDAGQSC